MNNKKDYIDLFRGKGFNCFPLPFGTKVADKRYNASRTEQNQPIHPHENYGVIPLRGSGTAVVDFDHNKYEKKLREIAEKYMVITTPHNGFHLPVKGLTGNVSKAELFDYDVQDKKIIEIQGPDHYVVGCMCEIIENNQTLGYTNIGTDIILDQGDMNFDDFIDKVCQLFGVVGRKRESRSSNQNLRIRFKEGKLPAKGTSNDYFFQAALYCNSEGYSKDEAEAKILEIFDQWRDSEHYSQSQRPWSNIQAKIDEVYDQDLKLKVGHPLKSETGFDRTKVAQELIANKMLYVDKNSQDIYENRGGFLENINAELHTELVTAYPKIESADLESVKFKIVGLAESIPQTNKDLIVFKNGIYSKMKHEFIETDDLADMGFKDYEYLGNDVEPPTEFLKILLDAVPDYEVPRVKAGLKAILSPYLDPKISVIHGMPRVGKSTALLILHVLLGQYSAVMELDQLLEDKFIRAKIKDKRLLVLQDLPKNFKQFATIKSVTGEQYKTERGFMQDSATFENKLKIWASGNYLAKIPELEKEAMYARLSLVHNIRTKPFMEDPTLIERIVRDEGSKILTWIVNLTDEECEYESSLDVRKGWERLASPEIGFIEDNFEIIETDEESNVSVMKIIKQFESEIKQHIDLKTMSQALLAQGFIIKFNVVKNIKPIVKQVKNSQAQL
jgi:hypothetical protein